MRSTYRAKAGRFENGLDSRGLVARPSVREDLLYAFGQRCPEVDGGLRRLWGEALYSRHEAKRLTLRGRAREMYMFCPEVPLQGCWNCKSVAERCADVLPALQLANRPITSLVGPVAPSFPARIAPRVSAARSRGELSYLHKRASHCQTSLRVIKWSGFRQSGQKDRRWQRRHKLL